MIEAWTTMPPPAYWEPVTVHVSYLERPMLRSWCGDESIACYHEGLNVVFLPVQCSPTRQRMARIETIDVGDLARNDFSFCGSVRAHEGGHVNSWNHD